MTALWGINTLLNRRMYVTLYRPQPPATQQLARIVTPYTLQNSDVAALKQVLATCANELQAETTFAEFEHEGFVATVFGNMHGTPPNAYERAMQELHTFIVNTASGNRVNNQVAFETGENDFTHQLSFYAHQIFRVTATAPTYFLKLRIVVPQVSQEYGRNPLHAVDMLLTAFSTWYQTTLPESLANISMQAARAHKKTNHESQQLIRFDAGDLHMPMSNIGMIPDAQMVISTEKQTLPSAHELSRLLTAIRHKIVQCAPDILYY